jgi:hypothetical protein
VSIQFLLALQLISDIVLFVAVIFLLAIVGRSSWKRNTAPPIPIDKQTIAEMERLISESQAATAHLIRAMDESRRALREAVCEVEEKDFRRVERKAAAGKAEAARLPAAARRQPAPGPDSPAVPEPGSAGGGRGKALVPSPENGRGNGHALKQGGSKSNGEADTASSADYQNVIEMARNGMSEKEIIEQSDLTEAEISLVLELNRKRNEIN